MIPREAIQNMRKAYEGVTVKHSRQEAKKMISDQEWDSDIAQRASLQ